MKTAIFPGSFDPCTNGHIDIINRASKLFDKLIVLVANNSEKKSMFSVDERIQLLKESTKNIENVEVLYYNGLVVDFASRNNINIIIKGLRNTMDFEYEFQIASVNKTVNPNIESCFIYTDCKYIYLSSSVVKEVLKHGGDISQMVPRCVEQKIISKIKEGD